MIQKINKYSRAGIHLLNYPLNIGFKSSPLMLRHYRKKISIDRKVGNFIIKTVDHRYELMKAMRLRYKSFLQNDTKFNIFPKYEIDEYDILADHLIVIDEKNSKVCATCRLLYSEWTNIFYSEKEFDISRFKNTPGEKLEIGRACVHSKYRNGRAINLLWHGISEYIRLLKPQYLFGCSSIKTMEPDMIRKVTHYLKDHTSYSYDIKPLDNYNVRNMHPGSTMNKDSEIENIIPPLLRVYLQCGAEVHGNPALDVEFSCIDFLTILNFEEMRGPFKKRYFESH